MKKNNPTRFTDYLKTKASNFKTILVIFLIALIIILQFQAESISQFFGHHDQYDYTTPITLAGNKLKAELADTPQKIVNGLSGRPNLPRQTGMLFVFDQPQIVRFWMPYMQFPIDMIFLRDNLVVAIEKNVPNHPPDTPLEDLPVYSPDRLVDMVLEVNAGWSDKNNIEIGDQLIINS